MVQIGDMYYAWGSDDEIAANGECGGAVDHPTEIPY